MDNKDRQDVLDSILDSMSMDDTMEKKIDEFSKTKQRKKRIERARETSEQFTQTYSTLHKEQDKDAANQDMNLTEADFQSLQFAKGNASDLSTQSIEKTQTIRGYAPEGNGTAQNAGNTMVYTSGSDIPQAAHSDTVVMSESEIKNLLGNDEQPLLKREYISDGAEEYEKAVSKSPGRNSYRKKKTGSWKIPVAIIGSVLGILLVYGGIQFFNNWIEQKQSESEQLKTAYYNEIMDWIASYDSLGDEGKKLITNLESRYNQLDEEQKRKINEQLKELTGKSFDELLALAKSANKQDPSNNNTEIAEQKAKLRDEISELTAQKEALQRELENIQSDINLKYQAYNTANQNLISAQNAYNAAVNRVNTAQNTVNSYAGSDPYTSQIQALQSSLDALNSASSGKDDDDHETGESVDVENQKKDLQSQIESLKSQQSSWQSSKNAAQTELNNANEALESARENLEGASSAFDQAESDYNSVINNDAGYQDQINSLQSQIDEKQGELDSLN